MAISVKGDLRILFPHRETNREVIIPSLLQARKESPLFSFQENETVVLELLSSDFEVILDCPSYRVYKEEEEPSTPKNGKLLLPIQQEIEISEGGDEALGYNPGKVRITIKEKEGERRKRELFFYVAPLKTVDALTLVRMKKELEDFSSGLSLDFLRSFQTEEGVINLEESSSLLFLLKAEEKNLFNHINHAQNTFSGKVEKVFEKGENFPKPSLKAIRYQLMHPFQSQSYGEKKILTYQTKKNQCLLFLCSRLNSLLLPYQKEIEDQLSEKENAVFEVKSKIAFTESNPSYASLQRNNLLKDYRSILNKRKKEKETYTSYQEAYTSALSSLHSFITFLIQKGIDRINHVPYTELFDSDLNYLYHFAREIEGKEIRKDIPTPRKKRSMVLFEEYGLYILHTLFSSSFSYTYQGKNERPLDEEAAFYYKKKEIRLKLVSNPHIPYYRDKKGEGIVSINSHQEKPDYLLTIYQKGNKGEDIFLGALVFEMKYRSINRLCSTLDTLTSSNNNKETPITEVEKTMDDYSQFGYRNVQGKVRKGVIKRVYVLYPDRETKKIETPLGDYFFGLDINEEEYGEFTKAVEEDMKEIIRENIVM